MNKLGFMYAVLASTVMSATMVFAQGYDRSKYPYSRADFGCKSPLDKVVDINNGTAILCRFADLDHRVPLKQAFDANLSPDKIRKLAKDRNNVVWTSSNINRAKGPLSSQGFEKVLKAKGEFDGRRFNKHLRGSIATKQQYGIPLDKREMQFAYKFKNVAPTKRISKFVAANTLREATKKVAKRYGTKVASQVVIRAGGTLVPVAGWALSGGLIAFDVGRFLYTGKCDVCDAAKYLQNLMTDQYETQIVANPVPTLSHGEGYRVLPTSFLELQVELNHVSALVESDPWGHHSDTAAHRAYLKQLNAELIKRKFS